MRGSGSDIHPDAFWVLISGYWKLGLPDKAVEAFGKMPEYNCEPNVYTYNKILNVLVKKEAMPVARAVFSKMSKSGCAPNQGTYCIMVDGLCKSGKIGEALQLFDEMTQRDVLPSKAIYTAMIMGLCRVGRIGDASKFFNGMKQDGCDPDAVTLGVVVDGFCRIGDFDGAYEVMRTLERDGIVLGIHGYTSCIKWLLEAKRIDEAMSWYQRMCSEGVKPDVQLYAVMIRGLVESNRMDDVFGLLEEMSRKGVVPNSYCYNALIKGLCDMGLFDKARSLQLDISENGGFDNACTYTILICALCREGLVEEAQEVFDYMEKIGRFPTVVSFNALMHGLCKAGKLREALVLLSRMDVGRNPSVLLHFSRRSGQFEKTIEKTVHQLCERGLYAKAYSIINRLANGGVVPDIFTYNTLINGYCKAGDIKAAVRFLDQLRSLDLKPDSVTYGTIIDGLLRADMEDELSGFLARMENDGLIHGSSAYKARMSWSSRKGKISVTFKLWMEYLKNLLSITDEITRAAEEQFEKGNVGAAVGEILSIEVHSKNHDSEPYNIMLLGLCRQGKIDEAFTLFSLMKSFQVRINATSCVKLIDGFSSADNVDAACEVFSYTLEKEYKLRRKICNKLLWQLLRSRGRRKQLSDIISKMQACGYDLEALLYRPTKSLLRLQEYIAEYGPAEESHG
ncbi:hypothetical protein MLD38_028801 [Melastoma candidum]|nr:hypothetical protein MLD38_028801 [Melastoma candidum]